MRRKLLRTLTACVLISNVMPVAAEHPQLKAFPAANPGVNRIVIELPHKTREEEKHFQVELVAGKDMLTDGVNQVRLGSQIKAKPLKGWGYTYYEVKESKLSISTLMAAPEGAPEINSFVTTAPLIISYNSRIPIVVYLPKGYQLRYRIWIAPENYQTAEPG